MYSHIVLIHSFIDGHLGCFQLSATVNNAAKEHRCTNMSLNPIVNSLGHIPNVAWLGHVVNVFFIFEEAPYCIHSCCPMLHCSSQCRKVQQQHLSKIKTVQRRIWLVQECHSVCRTKILSIVSWLFECLLLIKMLNLDFGVWGVEAPLAVTGGHKISLALQSCVGRTHFMSQSNRKHSPVISDSQWTLVPPPSRHLGDHCSLMLWLSWARVCSVQFSSTVVYDSLWPHDSQHARPPCPSPTPRVHSNSGPSSQWCHPAISSSAIPFSSFPQSLPASESFPMSQSSHEVAKVLEFQPQHQSFCASPQISSYSSPGQLLFHVTLQTMKQKVSRFQGPWWKKVQSLSALLSKPLKDSLHPYQRGEGIMIICSIVQGKGEKRWNVVSAKSDKLGWLISIQKSPFSPIQLMPTKHLWCARLRDGNFCFYRGRRLGFLDSSAEITIQLT